MMCCTTSVGRSVSNFCGIALVLRGAGEDEAVAV